MRFLRLCLLAAALPLFAHVGSPDVFFEGAAGPYRLLVTISPPQVVPGVAQVQIRSASPEVRQIRIVPLRLGFKGDQYAPVSDVAVPSKEDPQFFTGALWLMASGSWQVRIDVDGTKGPARLSVPVPALATRVMGMSKAIGAVLIPLGLVLCVGLVSIVGAAVRDAMLEPGKQPDAKRRRRAWITMGATAAGVCAILWLGNAWWGSEAGFYSRIVFKPLRLKPAIDSAGIMKLDFEDPGWLNRQTDDLLPDHNHLMHLYVIRVPDMSLVRHLHPERGDDGLFEQKLPAMPAGRYALYGDIVHANGLAETATADLDIPAQAGNPLIGDDAAGTASPLAEADYTRTASPLPGGYQMVFDRPATAVRARQPYDFRFNLVDADGRPAHDIELYMGMLGHAAFVADDRTVFAHVHPSGSVAMPALQLAQPDNPHAGHMMMGGAELPASVAFPYGFPKPGAYRVFVQMKRAGAVATGAFDVKVEP